MIVLFWIAVATMGCGVLIAALSSIEGAIRDADYADLIWVACVALFVWLKWWA